MLRIRDTSAKLRSTRTAVTARRSGFGIDYLPINKMPRASGGTFRRVVNVHGDQNCCGGRRRGHDRVASWEAADCTTHPPFP
jgi:hypothetical protein